MATLHYTSGSVSGQGFDPAAAAAGFDLADVGDAETLHSLPAGVKGVYYLDEAKGVTSDFVARMNAIKDSPNLFAVYLADEPVPSEIAAADLKAESDWIHANMPGVKTFIVAANMGSNREPHFEDYYTVESTHIDLWGLDPYPVRSEMETPDYTEIGRTVLAAESQIGVSAANIVPVFQAFGGVADGDGGQWVMPTAEQAKAIVDEFAKFVPDPAFDYVYNWTKQTGDTSLSDSPTLQQVFLEHNGQTGTPPSVPAEPTTPPVTTTPTLPTNSGSDGEPVSQSDSEEADGADTSPGDRIDAPHSQSSGSSRSDSLLADNEHDHRVDHDWTHDVPASASEDAFQFDAMTHWRDHTIEHSAHAQHQSHLDYLL